MTVANAIQSLTVDDLIGILWAALIGWGIGLAVVGLLSWGILKWMEKKFK